MIGEHDMEKVGVELEYLGDVDFKVKFGHGAMDDLVIVASRVPEDQRGGVARKLLAASVTYCMAGWLFTLLQKTRVEVNALKARTEVTMGKDESGRDFVDKIDIQIQVQISDEDVNAFERCKSIVDRGCLISRSLIRGVKVTNSISRT
jgi:osmotically inducible protein OsmC